MSAAPALGPAAFNKAERLVIAGAVAPVLRDGAEKARRRIVKTHSGRVVTLADVQAGLLKAKKIELEVVEGKRPKEIICACGAVVRVPKTGGVVPKQCQRCMHRKANHKWRTSPAVREAERLANREAARRRREDPAIRKAESAVQRRRMADPAKREAKREADRRRMADPAYREAKREACRKWRAAKKAAAAK